MGQRANLIVKQNGRWQLYYDHWCANRLDVELFWGPALALRFIEQREPVGESDWLDEIWCEGAALLDFDEDVLLFFGGEDIMWDVPLRRAHLALMHEMWPGWEIRWAHEGLVTVGTYVGKPKEMFLTDREPDPEQRFRILGDDPEDNRILLTVTRDGVTTAGRICGDEESLLLGPGALPELPELTGAAATGRLDWHGDMPLGGLHLDYDCSAFAYWSAGPTPAIEERVAAAWPGWDFAWLHDLYHAHIMLTGVDVLLPDKPFAELQAARVGSLQHRYHAQARNPAKELAERMGATDINPATDEARGSVGDAEEKRRILEALSRQFPGRPN